MPDFDENVGGGPESRGLGNNKHRPQASVERKVFSGLRFVLARPTRVRLGNLRKKGCPAWTRTVRLFPKEIRGMPMQALLKAMLFRSAGMN